MIGTSRGSFEEALEGLLKFIYSATKDEHEIKHGFLIWWHKLRAGLDPPDPPDMEARIEAAIDKLRDKPWSCFRALVRIDVEKALHYLEMSAKTDGAAKV